jgi:hypothetical protein
MWAEPLLLQHRQTTTPQLNAPPQPTQGHHARPIAADTKPDTTGQKSMGLTTKATVIPQETHRTPLHLLKGVELMCKRMALLTTRTTTQTIESLHSLA